MTRICKQKTYPHADLNNKIVVFTGGTDGMGKIAAQQLAQMGATLYLLGRNPAKMQSAVDACKTQAKHNRIYAVPCDLSDQKSIRHAAKQIQTKVSRVDLLINCAGANFGERKLSPQGYEMTWAVNHLAPFLLTHLLLNLLKAAPVARIVHLSSATEKSGHIHFDDIQLKHKWSTFRSYTQAKLALNMCTRKLSEQLRNTSITVNALNPGFIKTNLLHQIKGWERLLGVPYMFFCASKTSVGARRILRLALSNEYEGVSGQYVYEEAIRQPNPEALQPELVNRVWRLSLEQTGL